MPRFFYGNFDFEHRLAESGNEPSASLKRLNAELASSWLALAEEGDLVWTPWAIDPRFWLEAARQGLPRIVPITSLSSVPREVQCVPWGWSAEIQQLAARFQWKTNAPSDEAIRVANSRSTSEELERIWHVGLPHARRIESIVQFETALLEISLSSGSQNKSAWVVKATFSMSARERILGRGPATDANRNWIRRRLASHGAVFFEPWVDRIDEIGIQIDVPQKGFPRLIGVTPMGVDVRGQYAGSWFSHCELQLKHVAQLCSPHSSSQLCGERLGEEISWSLLKRNIPSTGTIARGDLTVIDGLWLDAIKVALRAAEHLQSHGYFGPLGIDSMIYRDDEGALRIRPLQDINARWTMGRLSLEWRRLLAPDEVGFWQHGGTEESSESLPFGPNRIIRTSPQRVGAETCRHQSRVLIGPAAAKVT